MIIIEGPDGSGKSTLVKSIRDMGKTVIKPYYPKVNQLSYYLHSPPNYFGYYLERYYLSEIVYPLFKKNRKPLDSWHQFQIEAALMPWAPVIIYLRPSKDTITKNINRRGDHYVSEEEVDEMVNIYDWAIKRSHIPSISYDYEKDDITSIIEEAEELYTERFDRCVQFQEYLFTGDCMRKDPLMIIGMDPSDKSIGEGYIRGMLSDNGSSEFLHRVLYEAGIYENEMPYFTNWGKGYDETEDKIRALNEEIENLKPRKIICLGNYVRDGSGIGGGTIEHPSFVKRFHSKDYSWYIDKIKELAK